jgi:hypothetical protein
MVFVQSGLSDNTLKREVPFTMNLARKRSSLLKAIGAKICNGDVAMRMKYYQSSDKHIINQLLIS